MSFRYRLHQDGLVSVLAVSLALTVAAALGLEAVWRSLALVPLVAAAACAALRAQGRAEARRLGAVELDDLEVRRVRGDGRLIAALRWSDVRRIVVDRAGRMVLFEGKSAQTLWWHGATPLVGGVGVERFDELLAEVRRHTAVVFSPPARPARRKAGAEAGSTGLAPSVTVG